MKQPWWLHVHFQMRVSLSDTPARIAPAHPAAETDLMGTWHLLGKVAGPAIGCWIRIKAYKPWFVDPDHYFML